MKNLRFFVSLVLSYYDANESLSMSKIFRFIKNHDPWKIRTTFWFGKNRNIKMFVAVLWDLNQSDYRYYE